MLCGLLLTSQSASAQDYEVKGWLSRNVKSIGDDKSDVKERYEFVVTVIAGLWHIRVTSNNGVYNYKETGTDGTNIYHLVNLKRKGERIKQESNNQVKNVASAVVLPGTIPQEVDDPAISVLWLAYVSGQFLQTNLSGRVPAFYPTGFKNPYSLRATKPGTWLLSPYRPFVPEKVIGYDSGTIDTWTNPSYGPWVVPPNKLTLPSPYDKGYTNFVYEVLQFTNRDGLLLPSNFRITRYTSLFAGESTVSLRLLSRMEGQLASAALLLERRSTLPEIPGDTVCADYRFAFAAEPVLRYFSYSFNGHWRTDDEVKAMPDFPRSVHANNQIVRQVVAQPPLPRPRPAALARTRLIMTLIGGSSLFVLYRLVSSSTWKHQGRDRRL